MKDKLLPILKLAAGASDADVIAAVTDRQARVDALGGTPLANLTAAGLKFAIARIDRGWTMARAVEVAPRLLALTADQQAQALEKERAGLQLEQAICAVHQQRQEDARTTNP